MYHHVNLISPAGAHTFLSTICTSENAIALSAAIPTRPLGQSVHNLHFSFSLAEMDEELWTLLAAALRSMTQLRTIGLSYSHDDMECLHRFIVDGELGSGLSPTVTRFHLKPVPDEVYDKECGPYDTMVCSLKFV